MPVAGVYRVMLFRIACIPASLMWSGVGKSGSPTAKLKTSTPSRFIAMARSLSTVVADGAMRSSFRVRGRVADMGMGRRVV